MQRGPASAAASTPRKRGLGGIWQGIRENPHQFLLVLIGVITLYVTYRIWKSKQAGSSGGAVPATGQGQPNWGTVTGSDGSISGTSGGGTSGGGNGWPYGQTLLPPLHESVYQNATNGGTAKSWYTSLGETIAQIAARFHLTPTALEYNPHNAMYHYQDNSLVTAGTDVWIPQSLIDQSLYQIQYNSSLGGQVQLHGPHNPTDKLP